MTHVDKFVSRPGGHAYARWMFLHFRLPAHMKIDFDPFMKKHRLFCTYQGARYRVTGASRMGDVWLTKDFKQHTGYELRVDLDECSDWGPGP